MLSYFLLNRYYYFVACALVVVGTSWCSEESPSDRLWEAIKKNDLAEVQTIVREHPDAIKYRTTTYLHIAAYRNLLPVVEILVREGGDIHALNQHGETPLHKAAQRGNVSIIEFLLDHGAVVDARDACQRTPLFWSSDLPTVRILVEAGADVNAEDFEAVTQLHQAALLLEFDALRYLVNKGADIEAVTQSRTRLRETALGIGITELSKSAHYGWVVSKDLDLCQYLLMRYAAVEENVQKTILSITRARSYKEALLKTLVERREVLMNILWEETDLPEDLIQLLYRFIT